MNRPMNQYANHSMQDSRNKSSLPRFDPSDNMLLRELIDKRPGLKEVNGDPKMLSELWCDLTAEYNKSALQYRGVATLRRKFKNIRDTIKKRLKEEAKKDDLLVKRPRLDYDNFINSSLGRQQFNAAMTSLSSFPVTGISSTMGMNLSGSATSNNFRDNSYGGSLSSDLTMSYDRPHFRSPPSERPTYSPPPTRDSFSNDRQSPGNNQRHSNHSNYSADEFDPFDPFDPPAEERQSYCEEESFREQDDNGDAADQPAPTALDYEIADRHRNKLDVEIACVKAEHQRFMMRMRRYHDIKMREANMTIQHMRSKHALECDYLRLKIKQVQAAMTRDGFGTIEWASGQHPQSEANRERHSSKQRKGLRGKQVVDLTETAQHGGVYKKVLESEMELFLESTGLKAEEDAEGLDDAEQTELNAKVEGV